MEERQRNAKRSDQEWLSLIHECRTSGLGDKEWCEMHGIPISSFYTKISRLRRKACDVPKAQHRVIRETQQVVPLTIVDELSDTCGNLRAEQDAARDTILNTLSVLQQLC